MFLNPRKPRPAAAVSASRQPKAYTGEPVVRVDSDAGSLWMPRSDGVMLPFIEKFHTWEKSEGTVLRALMPSGGTFVDIGANVGYFSCLIATHCQPARIIAFEPRPDLVRLLELNLIPRAARAQVEIFNAAAGDRHDSLALSSAAHNPGDTRVRDSLAEATCVAPIVPIDSVIHKPVSLVKIDVQGYEIDVIRGMLRTIDRSPGIHIVTEFWPTALVERGLEPKVVLRQLRSVGLTLRLLDGSQPRPVTDVEIIDRCASAGPDGQCNLLLTS